MSPNVRRLERLNSLLQAEISDIIRLEVKDPRVGFISVTRVETSADLRHARVRVSVMGSEEEKKRTMAALERAAAFIREKLVHRLDIRRIPQLDFLIDENIAYSMHITEVLNTLNRKADEESE